MLPNFLHIGAAKAASSWLWRMCQAHPEIYVPGAPDNVNFFTVHYQRGLDWYERTHFADHAGEPAVGEFSNSYMVHEPAMERIARDLPDVKLVAVLRNPVERAYLSWAHLHRKGAFGLNPDGGVAIPLERVVHHHGHEFFRLWIEPGQYAFLLRRLYRHVAPSRVLVLLYDDLCADASAFLARFFAFLGVDASFVPAGLHTQVNPDSPQADLTRDVPPHVRRELHAVYRDDIVDLERMLDRDLSAWQAEV